MQLIIKEISLWDSDVFVFDEEQNICLVNNERKNIEVPQTIQGLLNILCGASTTMVDNSVIDGTTFQIEIIKEGKKREYLFKNSFPKNFSKFIRILGGLKEC